MAEDPDDHGPTPAEVLESDSQDKHRQDFSDLADTHDGHDPIAWDSNTTGLAAGPEESSGPVEVAVVHKGIDERHEPEDQYEGVFEQSHGIHPSKAVVAADGAFRRGMGQR